MSAVFGWMSLCGRRVDLADIERMKAALSFPGRDPSSLHQEESLAFGHCPWRVTREDAFDRQPIRSDSGRYLVTADIRIYNRTELSERLGVDMRREELISDGVLLLMAWERWQAEALTRIEGDYAFALWDRKTAILHLARDPFGYRPLVWHRGKDFFAFASLPKALLVLPEVPRDINRTRVADHLALLPLDGEETLFRGIQRVLPGHRLEHGERVTRHVPARCLDPDKRIHLKSDDDYLHAFGEHLERAVGERLGTDRSVVASQLSGGFDSSTVTAIAARLLAGSGRGLVAFTAVPRDGFNGPVPRGKYGNEGPAATALARRFPNIDHRLVAVGRRSPLEGLHEANLIMDMPVINVVTRLWVERINTEASACGANVLLAGTMGNHTISQNGLGLLPTLARQHRWPHWWREASALHREGRSWRSLLAASLGPHLPPSFWSWRARKREEATEPYRHSAIRKEFAETVKLRERARSVGWPPDRRLLADTRRCAITSLARMDPGSYSVWFHRQGVEWRDPTADFRLAEFCLAIPEEQHLRNGQIRWLLRRLMGNTLPPEILSRPWKNELQAADWFEGLETARAEIGEWLDRLEESPAAREILGLVRMRQAFEDWPEGGWDQREIIDTYQLMLLRGLSMGSFIRYVEESNR